MQSIVGVVLHVQSQQANLAPEITRTWGHVHVKTSTIYKNPKQNDVHRCHIIGYLIVFFLHEW